MPTRTVMGTSSCSKAGGSSGHEGPEDTLANSRYPATTTFPGGHTHPRLETRAVDGGLSADPDRSVDGPGGSTGACEGPDGCDEAGLPRGHRPVNEEVSPPVPGDRRSGWPRCRRCPARPPACRPWPG